MTLDILNAQTGHTTIQFDSKDPAEVARAKAQIESLLKSGFAVFAEQGGKTERITKFDARRGKFLIGDQEAPENTKLTASPPNAGGCLRL
jgi:hypothetical protein